MKITEAKNIFRIVLTAVVFLSALSFNIDKAHALSCMPPQNIFIAAYEQGVFANGFVIEHRNTGNWCDTRPVVSDRTENLQNAFSFASQNLNQPISSGVYQLRTLCSASRWEEGRWCMEEITLKQISNSPSELARYKSEWQQKEREALRLVTTQLWSPVAIIVTVVALALIWPWILVRIWPNLRRRLSSLLIVAILLQAPLALILKDTFNFWSHSLWQTTASISSMVLLLAIVGEIIFIIIRKIRSRNVPV